jgi:hypothetical protein
MLPSWEAQSLQMRELLISIWHAGRDKNKKAPVIADRGSEVTMPF